MEKTRKELFEELKVAISLHFGSEPKKTVHEEFEMFTWGYNMRMPEAANYNNLKAHIQEEGYGKMFMGGAPQILYPREFSWEPDYETKSTTAVTTSTKKLLGLIYRSAKDSVSLNHLEYGYSWAHKKQRYYPVRKCTPVLTYNQNGMWMFNQWGKPRIFQGGHSSWAKTHENTDVRDAADIFVRRVTNFPGNWRQLSASFKEFFGAADRYELMKRKYGVTVPKALRYLCDHDLNDLCVTVSQNDMNTLCRLISADPNLVGPSPQTIRVGGQGLSKLLAAHFPMSVWSMGDWIADHVVLKRKFNFKITSEKRCQEEHRTMSYERAVKQMMNFKTDEKYFDTLSTIDPSVKVELINTKERILQESRTMRHCVATYASKVKDGDCAIFHLEYEGKPYTLEVSNEGGNFWMRQLVTIQNHLAPPSLHAHVSAALAAHNEQMIENLRKHARIEEAPTRNLVGENSNLAQAV